MRLETEFDRLTPIGSFILIIEGRYAGDFYTPLPLVGSIKYYCRFCGEIFAMRVVEGKMWQADSGVCKVCPKSIHNGAYQSFRTYGEEALGFAPVRLLAEEFLFNSKEYASECSSQPIDLYARLCGITSYHTGVDPRAEDHPVR